MHSQHDLFECVADTPKREAARAKSTARLSSPRAGQTLSRAEVVHLQRTVGNAAVARMLRGGRSSVLDVVGRGGGCPVDGGVRSEMERAFGQDFSDVRIHTGPAASQSAASFQASAFTVGNEIVFRDAGYSPDTADGKRLLAHELTHVVQQRQGRVDGALQAGGIAVSSPGDRFERAAQANADRVMTTLAQPAGCAHPTPEAVGRPAARGADAGGPVTVQRNEESERLLKALATPQVREGPSIAVQKALVEGMEERLAAIIQSDAEKQRVYDDARAQHTAALEKWNAAWSWFRGAAPELTTPSPFGSGKRLQVTAENALEFNLGGILIDSLPVYSEGNGAGLYKGLIEQAKLVPLDSRVRGARSSGTALPELVSGLGPLLLENTLKTMIDAGQFKYLQAAGLPNAEWKILVEVHYIRARPKDMAGFHKDTQGQTLFVNLNYHVGDYSLRGPEYVVNPPSSPTHDARIYGTEGKPGTLPKPFTDDLTVIRGQLGEATEIRSSGTVRPYGYVAFVDEAIHHATPFFDHRYVTPAEFKGYLERTDKAKLDEIVRANGTPQDVNTSIIEAGDIKKWNTWREMISGPSAARYTRETFLPTMSGAEFDLMLENVGAVQNAERQRGGAGGWYSASIPNDGRAPIHASNKPPLIRQASNPQLTKDWPKQLPEDVPRRFLRTWVRAVPKGMADQLRGLSG